MAAAAALLLGGAVGAQEPAKQKDKQLPAPKDVVMQGANGVYFSTRDWHAGPGYGNGPMPYGRGYYAPFYMGYYPGYGMGYFGYDWSPARMRITEINVSTTPPAVPGAGAPVKSGDSTARALVMPVKEWADAKTFVDEKGRRWTLSSGKELDGRPKMLSGWMLQSEDGTQVFYTASGRLFRLEAAPKEKGKE
jgi:hypothetical protein